MKTTKRNAILYARVSTDTQSGKQALKKQLKELRQHCKKNKLQVVAELSEVKSGIQDTESLQTMVTQTVVDSAPIHVLVTTDLGRICRTASTCRQFCEYLEAQNIDLRLTHTGPGLTESITVNLAKQDSLERSRRIKAGIARKKQEKQRQSKQ